METRPLRSSVKRSNQHLYAMLFPPSTPPPPTAWNACHAPARNRGVLPSSSSSSSPRASDRPSTHRRHSATVSVQPTSAARCSTVDSSCVVLFTAMPWARACCSRVVTVRGFFAFAAVCIGSCLSYFDMRLASAPCPSSSCAMVTVSASASCLAAAACPRAV